MPYGTRAVYRKRSGRTRKTAIRRKPTGTPSWKRTVGGFKAQGGTSIPRGIFPISTMKKLRYVDTISINPAINSRASHVFRANDVFDPDFTSGGHQPRGFDQMALFYNKFTVIGSKLTARYIPNVTKAVDSTPIWLWSVLSTVNDPLSGEAVSSLLWESGMWKNRTLVRGGDETNTLRLPTTTSSFSAKKFYKASSIVGNDTYTSSVTGSPSEQAYHTIYMQGVDPSVDQPSYDFEVTIDYFVVFTEPKQIGSS